MKNIVRAAWFNFTANYEGVVYEMYTDVLGLVTCGVGNLIDPMITALGLPWTRRSDGLPATGSDIAAEWSAIKTGRLAWYPGRAPRPLYLTPQAVRNLVDGKLSNNEAYISRRFSNWEAVPADAQLAVHSIAWAAGSAWHAPKFDALFAQCDFRAIGGDIQDPDSRGEGWLNDTGDPGLRPRNLANKQLFNNAAVVLADGRDPNILYWPTPLDG